MLTGGVVLPGTGAGFTEPVPPSGVVPVAGAGMFRTGSGTVAPGACDVDSGTVVSGTTGAGFAAAGGRGSITAPGIGVTPEGFLTLSVQTFASLGGTTGGVVAGGGLSVGTVGRLGRPMKTGLPQRNIIHVFDPSGRVISMALRSPPIPDDASTP